MRTRITLTTCVALLTTCCLGQKDAILQAPTYRSTVYFDVDLLGKQLLIIGSGKEGGPIDWDDAILQPEPLVLVRDNAYNLRMRARNPLRFFASVESGTFEADPYEETLKDVTGTLQSIIGLVSGSTLNFGSVTEDQRRFSSTQTPEESQTTVPEFPKLQAIEPPDRPGRQTKAGSVRDYDIQRAILLLEQINSSNDGDPLDPIKQLVDSVSANARRIEAIAYEDLRATVSSIVNDLSAIDISIADDITKEHLAAIKSRIHAIAERDELLKSRLTQLDNLGRIKWLGPKKVFQAGKYTNVCDTVIINISDLGQEKSWNDCIIAHRTAHETDDFQSFWTGSTNAPDRKSISYLGVSIAQFQERGLKIQKERDKLVANLNSLFDRLIEHRDEASASESKSILVPPRASVPSGKVAKVAITIKERKLKVDDNAGISVDETSLFKKELKIGRAHTMYPQVFPAAVFTKLVSPTYTAQADSLGATRVTYSTGVENFLTAGLMVNFNMKLDRRAEVPFLQLGAAYKKDRPLVMLGVGMRFTEWFGVSLGGAFAWHQQLNELHEGDRVKDQATLDKDIKYEFAQPQMYFAIQLRPSALTSNP